MAMGDVRAQPEYDILLRGGRQDAAFDVRFLTEALHRTTSGITSWYRVGIRSARERASTLRL